MTDVHDLLARTRQALGDGVTLDDARHDALFTGIRRRRRRRHAAEVLGVSALVLVLAAGGWAGLSRDATPQPAQSTSPTPSPVPTPDADAAPQPAPDAPGLLPALVMPPGTLEASTPGWVLTVQQPRTPSQTGDGSFTTTAHVVDTVAPDGTRYRVVNLPLEPAVDLVRWDAGTTEALVTTYAEDERAVERLDLLTGDLVPLAGLAGVSEHVGRTPAGLDVWIGATESELLVHDGSAVVRDLPFVRGPVLEPSGARVAGTLDGVVVTVDVATGEVTEVAPPTDVDCQVLAWHGADLVVWCLGWEGSAPVSTEVFRIAADGSDVEGESLGLPVDRLPAQRALPLADGRLAVQHSFDVECTRGWGLLDAEAGTLQDVPLDVAGVPAGEASVRVQGVAGDVVLLTVGDACSGGDGTLRVLRYDVTTGAQTQVAGPPSDATADTPLDATTSTILAH